MNQNQKLLTFGALALFCLSVLFAPWEASLSAGGDTINLGTKYSPVWASPEPPPGTIYSRVSLKIDSILIEWAAIGIVYGVLFALLKATAKKETISN